MQENRLPHPTRLSERGRHRPQPPTYRYRVGGRDGRQVPFRLSTVDLDLLGLKTGDRILDVGCGSGRHVVEACRRDCYAVAADLDIQELTIAKGYLYCLACEGGLRARVNLLSAAAERLPFADMSFDRVICTETLEHVPDDGLVVSELARVLRPGGTISVSVPDRLAEAVLWRLASLRRRPPGGHLRIYGRRQLAGLLEAGGLAVYARRYRHSLESLYWFFRIGAKGGNGGRPLSAIWEDFLEDRTAAGSHVLKTIEDIGDHLLPKSIVLYARKPSLGRDG